ncbi:MAG: FAD-binding oxidoreductase [Verrucomicrobiales bacterium]|nr:FAD-binding oxidoreductase [Verrucomicrobiales bacterium]
MSEEHKVIIKEIEAVTRDVGRFVTTRPDDYEFEPGQATEVAIALDGWKDEKRPFTFTSLPSDPFLEFTIKIYPERDGVTDRIAELQIGEELILGDPWGAIEYKGPGAFVAGGAGITPFISILRDLEKKEEIRGNRLLFSNETEDDIILAGEFKRMLGDDALFTVTDETSATYHEGRIDREFLEKEIEDFDQFFYVCGPPKMVEDVKNDLIDLGADEDKIIHEEAA